MTFRRDKWILDGHTPVVCNDLIQWGKWMQSDKGIVKQDTLPNDVRVSTVFLGLDHNYDDEGPPLLFETMVFGGGIHDQSMRRYSTWEEAEAGHSEMLEFVK